MPPDLFCWGTYHERERRTRIRLCVLAYAYEIAHLPIVSDAEYDALARMSDPRIETGQYDEWWRANYTSYSGAWINDHPDLDGIRRLYEYLAECVR